MLPVVGCVALCVVVVGEQILNPLKIWSALVDELVVTTEEMAPVETAANEMGASLVVLGTEIGVI